LFAKESPAMTAHQPDPSGPARIGPNSIIRMAEALRAQQGEARTAELFAAAGLERYLTEPPGAMVLEEEVIRLHHAVRAGIGLDAAARAGWEAGQRTGTYLLAHRIPKPAQAVLKLMPPALAARALVKAIGQHAWTFAGSGQFSAAFGHPLRLTIAHCPTARDARADQPLCAFYAGTFERIFSELVSPNITVREVACAAMGAPACVFELRWK